MSRVRSFAFVPARTAKQLQLVLMVEFNLDAGTGLKMLVQGYPRRLAADVGSVPASPLVLDMIVQMFMRFSSFSSRVLGGEFGYMCRRSRVRASRPVVLTTDLRGRSNSINLSLLSA